MKITTWNINSIRARKGHVLDWLQNNRPDILMLQELKTSDFPSDIFDDAGYHSLFKGQKAYNGVAILSRMPLQERRTVLSGDKTDDQARYIEAKDPQTGLRFVNIYLPNGNPVDSDKFSYKLAWMERLYARISSLRAWRVPFLVGGDFNVIPADIDCHDPVAWQGDALASPQARQLFRSYLYTGLTEAFRALHPDVSGRYTYWGYQDGAWIQGHGIRIDHFLLSPALADRLVACTIDREERSRDKPSDHVPVTVEIEPV